MKISFIPLHEYKIIPGGTDILSWKSVGTRNDAYINGISLILTDEDTKLPLYYVTIKSVNGAGIISEPVVSTPIIVVDEDQPGMYSKNHVIFQNNVWFCIHYCILHI